MPRGRRQLLDVLNAYHQPARCPRTRQGNDMKIIDQSVTRNGLDRKDEQAQFALDISGHSNDAAYATGKFA